MTAHKPRSGSLAFYPRVRAKNHTARFRTFPSVENAEASKAIGFFGFKAGMVHIFGKNAHEKGVSFGQEVMVPATVIECPPLRVIGARVYGKENGSTFALGEATIDKPGKFLREKIAAFKKKGKNAGKEKKGKKEVKGAKENEGKEEVGKDEVKGNYATFDDIEKMKENTVGVVLLVETQPSATGIGRKKPDVAELPLSGNIDQQFAFAKEKFGKELRISEVFSAAEFIDVKAVDKGKGFQGPVKRFGVKVHRPKAKKHRYVGSISPWHPATVMWTVPRPGQMGYQNRTEYNKRILFVDNKIDALNPKSGFSKYGKVKNEFLILAGSVPGPAKRVIALRHSIRKADASNAKYTDLKLPNEVTA